MIIKYRLTNYTSKMHLTEKAVNCKLKFDVIFIKWKIADKEVTVKLSNYVVWRDFFDFWDESIKNKYLFSKQALKTTLF